MKAMISWQHQVSILKDKRGMAIPIVLLIMVVLLIFSLALMGSSLAETKFAVYQNQQVQSHYLARSGVQLGYERLATLTDTGYEGTLDELVDDLNGSGAYDAANPEKIDVVSTDKYADLYFEMIGRDIKIVSKGVVNTGSNIADVVTLTVRMNISLLNSTRPSEWYNGTTLAHSNTTSYIGKGVPLYASENNNNSPTHFPSNQESWFQATIMKFLEDRNGVSLAYNGTTDTTNFDAEIFIFDGDVELNGVLSKRGPLNLLLSQIVAENKISNEDNVLYVEDESLHASLAAGVGFENQIYYEYYVGEVYARYADYVPLFEHEDPADTSTPLRRYGVVVFDGDLKYGSTAQSVGNDYYFFPDGINLSDPTQLSRLIRIYSDDPIRDQIEMINEIVINRDSAVKWDRQ